VGADLAKQNLIVDKSFGYALSIELHKFLVNEKKEYVLSKQVLRSGTSVGANVREVSVSQSKKEFIVKMNISLKEIHDTEYWLQLLFKSNYINEAQALLKETDELIRILTSIVKTSNENSR
jgi:four helix bundle protein